MNYKTTNIIFLVFLILVILSYLIPSIGFVIEADDTFINDRFYPTLLGVIALILSLIKLVEIILKENDDKIFTVPNLKIIVVTFLATIIYVFLWYTFRDLFYIFTFIFIMFLSLIYSRARDELTKKIIIRNSVFSVVITIVIFVIFGQIFSVRF